MKECCKIVEAEREMGCKICVYQEQHLMDTAFSAVLIFIVAYTKMLFNSWDVSTPSGLQTSHCDDDSITLLTNSSV
jgi:hypothetical protein